MLGIKYVVYLILKKKKCSLSNIKRLYYIFLPKDYITFKPNKSNIFICIYLDFSNILFPWSNRNNLEHEIDSL